MARTMPAMTVGKAAGLPEALFIESGHRRLTPVSVQSDQLLCLPEPLMPENGFSWISAARPARAIDDANSLS